MAATATRRKLVTEINMIPFIDVVLVLLIVFMILSPFLSQGEIPVNLPRISAKNPTESDDPINVRITKDGDFYLGKDRVLRVDIEPRLKGLLTSNAKKAVLIQADRDVSFKNVVLVLDAAQRLGALKVGVGVEQPRPGSEDSPSSTEETTAAPPEGTPSP
jgi:biopolymer transport protein ExbD